MINQPSGRQVTAISVPEPPEGMEPTYSNMARIGHTAAEFVLDFVRLFPGDRQAKYISRLVMSPVGVKLLYRALGDNLARYEAAFGEIQIPTGPSLADTLFRSSNPPEKGE